jgi:hypothetical protein
MYIDENLINGVTNCPIWLQAVVVIIGYLVTYAIFLLSAMFLSLMLACAFFIPLTFYKEENYKIISTLFLGYKKFTLLTLLYWITFGLISLILILFIHILRITIKKLIKFFTSPIIKKK